MTASKKGVLYAFVTTTLWGFLAIAQKIMLQHLDTVSIVWTRFAIAFPILLLYMYKQHPQQLSIFRKPPWLIFVGGIALLTNYIAVLAALDHTSPNTVQIIIQSAPIMLCLISIFVFKEKTSRLQNIGFLLASIGLIIFYRSQLQEFVSNIEAFNTGFLLVMLGAIGWVAYAVVQKILVRNYHPQALNLILYAMPVLLIAHEVDFHTIANLSLPAAGLLLFLGINTLLAYGALSAALKLTEANKVSVIINLNPIITVVCMAIIAECEINLLAGETMGPTAILGGVLLLAGAFLVAGFRKK